MTDFMQILNERGRGTLDKKMGIEIIEASPQRLVGTMPVEGNTQPFGRYALITLKSPTIKVNAHARHELLV